MYIHSNYLWNQQMSTHSLPHDHMLLTHVCIRVPFPSMNLHFRPPLLLTSAPWLAPDFIFSASVILRSLLEECSRQSLKLLLSDSSRKFRHCSPSQPGGFLPQSSTCVEPSFKFPPGPDGPLANFTAFAFRPMTLEHWKTPPILELLVVR